MNNFPYLKIVLHNRTNDEGWAVFAIPRFSSKDRELVALIKPIAGKDIARSVASAAALQLTGKAEYDED